MKDTSAKISVRKLAIRRSPRTTPSLHARDMHPLKPSPFIRSLGIRLKDSLDRELTIWMTWVMLDTPDLIPVRESSVNPDSLFFFSPVSSAGLCANTARFADQG